MSNILIIEDEINNLKMLTNHVLKSIMLKRGDEYG